MPESLVLLFNFQVLTSMVLLTLTCLFACPSYSQFGAFLPSPFAPLKTLTCTLAQSVGYIVSFLPFLPLNSGIPLATEVIFSCNLLFLDFCMLAIFRGRMLSGLAKLRTLGLPVPGDCSYGISYQPLHILTNSDPLRSNA